MRAPAACTALLAASAWIGCAPPSDTVPADLVLLNGNVVTLDEATPQATAIAVRDGRIVAVGGDDVVRRHEGPDTRVIDLEGKLAVPGFIESHGHFTGIGNSLLNIDLRSARSWDEIVEKIRLASSDVPAGQWILGWGWHQDKWDEPPTPSVEGYPTHEMLSRALPDHPVLLKHAAGSHAGLVNARAMALAGIGPDTPDPEGGSILRDDQGQPTGVLRETAYALALRAHEQSIAHATAEEAVARTTRQAELAAHECLSHGVTTFHDAGSDFETIATLRDLSEHDRLGVRLWVMVREPSSSLEGRVDALRIIGAADDHFTVRAIKVSVDGALGSHGAWLLEPYTDLPSSVGLNTTDLEEMERLARIAADHDMQLCVHAIGDRGNRETLDLFQRTFEAHPERNDWRWRIEHAQHLHLDDIPRFAKLGIIASMQSVHCTSDGPWVPRRLGEQRSREGAYVWRKLIESGATICNGTDAPIENLDPMANFHSAVTRAMGNGELFYPDQRMSRIEALRSYTLNAAYAAHEEDLKGSLGVGKLADIVVLSQDILSVPEEQIRDTKVVYTIVGGEVRYTGEGERIAAGS